MRTLFAYRLVGGLHFIRIGPLSISWCRTSKPHPYHRRSPTLDGLVVFIQVLAALALCPAACDHIPDTTAP